MASSRCLGASVTLLTSSVAGWRAAAACVRTQLCRCTAGGRQAEALTQFGGRSIMPALPTVTFAHGYFCTEKP